MVRRNGIVRQDRSPAPARLTSSNGTMSLQPLFESWLGLHEPSFASGK